MTPTETPATKRLSRARSYRQLFFGLIGAGVVLNVALRVLDYPLAAEATYLLGFLAAVAVWRGTSLTLFDERDEAIERRASQLALSASALVLIFGASAARVASATGVYDVPAAVHGFLYGYVAVFVTFGLAFAYVRSRR